MNLSTITILGCLIVAAIASRGYRNKTIASQKKKEDTEVELSEF